MIELQGLISDEVGERLTTLAATVPPNTTIVEIGSYKGKSTCYLAEGARRAGVKVCAFDPWSLAGNETGRHHYADPATKRMFDEQVERAGYQDIVLATQAFSVDAAALWLGPPISLIFIDGSHLYEDVLADFNAWRPHLTDDALVLFDDYNTKRNPGVKKAVDELDAAGEIDIIDLFTPPLAISCLVLQ